MTLEQLIYEAYASGRDLGFATGVRRGKTIPGLFSDEAIADLEAAARSREAAFEQAYGEQFNKKG